VSTLLADLLREGLTFLALFCLVFVLNWRLTLAVLLVGPVVYLLTVRFGRTASKDRSLDSGRNRRRSGHRTGEHLRPPNRKSIRKWKAFEQRRFRDALLNLARTQVRAAKVVYLSSPILELLGC